jgi:hypothetical protein
MKTVTHGEVICKKSIMYTTQTNQDHTTTTSVNLGYACFNRNKVQDAVISKQVAGNSIQDGTNKMALTTD